MSFASSSRKTERASSKETRCFRRLTRCFLSFHVKWMSRIFEHCNYIGIQNARRVQHAKSDHFQLEFAGLGGADSFEGEVMGVVVVRREIGPVESVRQSL